MPFTVTKYEHLDNDVRAWHHGEKLQVSVCER